MEHIQTIAILRGQLEKSNERIKQAMNSVDSLVNRNRGLTLRADSLENEVNMLRKYAFNEHSELLAEVIRLRIELVEMSKSRNYTTGRSS